MSTSSRIAITRREYDLLLDAYPEWMARAWCALDRKWCLGGVIVKGADIFIDEIRNKLESAKLVKA